MSSTLTETARAKVNLTLRILGRRPDGYHELESLVAFADVGDVVTLRVGAPVGVTVSGPFAGAIDGENIVERAIRRLAEIAPSLRLGAVNIDKRLPVAAGIGGGSADAAAVLRAIRQANPDLASTVDWLAIAASLGADVPVCLASAAQFMWGIGRETSRLPGLPSLPALLVNPGVPLSTAPVFRALNAPLAPVRAVPPAMPGPFDDANSVIAFVQASGNDLEAPACALCPEVGDVLAALATAPGASVARMSGSGATCFAIFATAADAEAAARHLSARNPGWWVVATALR